MQEQKGKMKKSDWFDLYFGAAFFDFCGWIILIPDIVCMGYLGRILDFFAAGVFAFSITNWKDKGIISAGSMTGVITSYAVGEGVLCIPWVGLIGDLIPKWIGFIYLLKKNYGKSVVGAVTGAVAGKVAGGASAQIAGSNWTDSTKKWATRATGVASDMAQGQSFSGATMSARRREKMAQGQEPTSENTGNASPQRPVVGDEIRPPQAPSNESLPQAA